MSGVYSVWTQIVDDYTTPENIDAYGSVHDVFAEQEDDDTGTPNKQFCDGQTSKTPPRYAQDNMIGIYTRSEESAQIISDFLRQDVIARVNSGELVLRAIPSWFPPGFIPPTAAPVAAPGAANAAESFVPAQTREEAIARLKDITGATNIDLPDNLSLDGYNNILRATEDMSMKYDIKLTSIRHANIGANARMGGKTLTFDTGYLTSPGRVPTVIYLDENIQDQVRVLRGYIANNESMLLGETNRTAINRINRQIHDLEARIRAVQDCRRWSISNSVTSSSRLYYTTTHELYHLVDASNPGLLGVTGDGIFDNAVKELMESRGLTRASDFDALSATVSDYARTLYKGTKDGRMLNAELFAELGTALDAGLKVDPGLAELFNEIMKGYEI